MLLILSIGLSLATPLSEALQTGNCAKALECDASNATPAQELALAKCILAAGDGRTAIEIFQKLEDHKELAPYARYLRAEASYDSEDYKTTAALLESPFPFSAQSMRKIALLRGKAFIQNGDYIAGRDAIRPILDTHIAEQAYIPDPMDADPAEARWWLAEGARLRGAPEAGKSVLYRIWTDNPTSMYAEKAESRLISMGERIPDSTTEKGRNYIKRRAKSFRKLQHHKESIALLDLLPVQKTSPKSLAYSAFRAKDYSRAVTLFSRLSDPTGEDLFNLAVAHSRTDNYQQATVAYQKIIDTYPEHKRADIASYKLGYLQYDKGNYAEAIPLFKAHLKRFPQTNFGESTRWFIGWGYFKMGHFDDAEGAFEALVAFSPKSDLAAAAVYWRGVIAEQRGQADVAKGLYEEVLKYWPVSGHAWYAARKIGHQFPKQPIAERPEPPDELNTSEFQLGIALADAGFDAWARDQLRPLVKVAQQSKEGTLAMAHALILAGDYQKAKSMAAPFCTRPWKGGSAVAMQACYPRPHGQALKSQIGDHPLPSLLPFAIMTAESGFKPEVSSPVGARGLMQLMPKVAADLHRSQYPAINFDPDQLFQAGYNATLGTQELMRLYTALSEQAVDEPLPLAIAGYNGGEEAVLRWMSLYEDAVTAARFGEDVGYTETRRYVRKVLGYLMAYRYVYGDD